MNDAALDALLLAAFFRRDCPDTMTLGDYHTGMLSSEKTEAVRAHLGRCPHCNDEYLD